MSAATNSVLKSSSVVYIQHHWTRTIHCLAKCGAWLEDSSTHNVKRANWKHVKGVGLICATCTRNHFTHIDSIREASHDDQA